MQISFTVAHTLNVAYIHRHVSDHFRWKCMHQHMRSLFHFEAIILVFLHCVQTKATLQMKMTEEKRLSALLTSLGSIRSIGCHKSDQNRAVCRVWIDRKIHFHCDALLLHVHDNLGDESFKNCHHDGLLESALERSKCNAWPNWILNKWKKKKKNDELCTGVYACGIDHFKVDIESS